MSTSYPSKIVPPADNAFSNHVVGLFDDFVGASHVPAESTYYIYNGVPGGTNGRWLSSHVVVTNSVCELLAYQDVLSNDPAALNWAGGGMQTRTRWPVGTIFHVAMQYDELPGFTPILLTMGDTWPPEIDFFEGGHAWAHWGEGNSHKVGIAVPLRFIDTQWHHYALHWGADVIRVYVDNELVASMPNPSAPGEAYGLQEPQFLAMQYQSGDGGTLVNRPDITAHNAPAMRIDWVKIFVPKA